MPLTSTDSTTLLTKVGQLDRLIDEGMTEVTSRCLACLDALREQIECPNLQHALEITSYLIYREVLKRELFLREME